MLGVTPIWRERRACAKRKMTSIKQDRFTLKRKWAWKRWASGTRKDYPIDSTPIELFQIAVLQLLIAGPHYNWMYRAAWNYDAEPALRALQCPVLLLNAGEDPLADKDEEVASVLPNARIVHLEGLTGQLPWRVPERFTSEIEKFLAVGAMRA